LTIAPLSALDAAFLAAETPTQHLQVLATLVLDTSGRELGYREFQARIAERYPLIEPLRRRLQPVPFGDPVWVDDDDVHLGSHLHHVHVDGGGLDALARVAASLASRPLDRSRPLWEAWLVEGFAPDRSAVIAKVHHCAVDGVTGFEALAAFFDLEADPAEPLWTGTWTPGAAPTTADLVRHAATSAVGAAGGAARAVRHVASAAGSLLRSTSSDVPLPLTAPRLSFNGPLTARRDVRFTSIPLDDVKTVRRAFDVTVNDVVTALVAGALRRVLVAHDEVPDRPLVAAVPTSERSAEDGAGGNRISAMFYALPVHLDDVAARIEAVQRSASAAKEVHAVAGVGTGAAIAALVPPRVVGPVMRAISGLGLARVVPPLANVIVSNVRGPDLPLYVAGARVESIYPMGPLMEGTGLGVTVATYRDALGVGMLACPDLLPQLGALVDAIDAELAALLAAAS